MNHHEVTFTVENCYFCLFHISSIFLAFIFCCLLSSVWESLCLVVLVCVSGLCVCYINISFLLSTILIEQPSSVFICFYMFLYVLSESQENMFRYHFYPNIKNGIDVYV